MKPELKKAVDDLVEFAVSRHRSGDIPGAVALYGKAIELSPSNSAALHNLGLIYLGDGDLSSALLLLSEAVRQRPSEATFNYNYALALQQQGALTQSLEYYDRALEARPAYREALENRGVVLQDLERFDEAIASYRRALEIDPASHVSIRNLGNALRVVGRLDDALSHYRQAIDRAPLDTEIVFNYGATLITKGNYVEGWPLREWRLWTPEFLETNPPYRVPLPHWEGDDLAGKSLLVYGEQGIGDEIMFASCFHDLTKQTDGLTVLCEPRLVPLFARSFEAVKCIPKEKGEHPPHDEEENWIADYCIAMGSLPAIFRLTERAFPGTPYLSPDAVTIEKWRRRLSAWDGSIKIGISWRGGAETRAKKARSISLERFAPLFARPGLNFFNVQYGDHAEEIESFNELSTNPLVCLAEIDPLRDMDGFAAFLSALDLVITVDNSTAHLAGALGVPTWMLLPAHADSRWLKGRNDTPWYRSVQIFWQEEHLDAAWDEVIARLGIALNSCNNSLHRLAASAGSPQEPVANLIPATATQEKPVALLLNDTSYWYHWGCSATTLALHEGLRAKGYWVDSVAITVFNRLSPVPSNIDDFDSENFRQQFVDANEKLVEQIRRCDAVVVNGEGTLHGLGRTPLALLYTAYFSKRWLGKNTRIVNHSCYPEGQADTGIADSIYRKVYGALDYIAVRESQSMQEMLRLDVPATESFDCLPLYLAKHGPMPRSPDQKARRIVIAGSAALTRALVDCMMEVTDMLLSRGYELQVLVGANAYLAADDVQFVNAFHQRFKGKYSLTATHSEAAWLAAIAEASLLVSGRFHHTIAAAFLGTPVAVAASNTRKIEGLLERLQLPAENVCLDVANPSEAACKVRELLRSPQLGLVEDGVLKRLSEMACLNFADLPEAKAILAGSS